VSWCRRAAAPCPVRWWAGRHPTPERRDGVAGHVAEQELGAPVHRSGLVTVGTRDARRSDDHGECAHRPILNRAAGADAGAGAGARPHVRARTRTPARAETRERARAPAAARPPPTCADDDRGPTVPGRRGKRPGAGSRSRRGGSWGKLLSVRTCSPNVTLAILTVAAKLCKCIRQIPHDFSQRTRKHGVARSGRYGHAPDRQEEVVKTSGRRPKPDRQAPAARHRASPAA
jgi:hypothetical protein